MADIDLLAYAGEGRRELRGHRLARGYRMLSADEQTTQERVLEEWGQQWSAHSLDELLALHTDDVVLEDVARGAAFHGKDELRAYAEAFFAGYPDVTFEVTCRFAAG